MIRKGFIVLGLASWAVTASAYEWTHVGTSDRMGGRMISAGYLKGKVVLVDRRDYTDPAQVKAIKALQSVWATYKTKPFILLGSHRGKGSAAEVEGVMKRLGVTYPVYRDAWYMKPDAKEGEAEIIQSIFDDPNPIVAVFDSTMRRRLYCGGDVHAAQGVIPSALMAAARPMSPKQFNFLLDWETGNLPGKAFNRLRDYRQQFPRDAAKYDAFWDKASGSDEIKRLGKLVELSRLVKDRDLNDARSQRITPDVLEKALEKYSDLKQSADAAVAQEAKNALADIKWSASSL